MTMAFLRRSAIFLFLLSTQFGCVSFNAQAQTKDDSFQTRLTQARTLYELGKATEAMPLFEELVKQKPDNIPALEGYGMTLFMSSATVTDATEKKRMRAEARKVLIKAQQLGDKSNLAKNLDDIPEDGSFSALSDRADVDAALNAGEANYAKGNYEDAIANYEKALTLDPKNYLGALFIGDVMFKQAKYDGAGTWFARAIDINPNRETAYRYWGDALGAQGKWDEAKSKFIEAIVAEPYERNSWIGLSQWADARGMHLVRPNITPPAKVEEKDDKNININLNLSSMNDKNDLSGAAWLMYPMVHVVWKNEGEFLKKFPNEKQYRHSLAEEMSAFGGALEVLKGAKERQRKKTFESDPQLKTLFELDSKGLLEPYILIHRADQGIAQDYAAYRDAHRDKLREYVASLIQPKAER